MVRYELKVTERGFVYLPKEVRESLGMDLKLAPNIAAAILFRKDVPLEKVIESVELLLKDLKLEAELKGDRQRC